MLTSSHILLNKYSKFQLFSSVPPLTSQPLILSLHSELMAPSHFWGEGTLWILSVSVSLISILSCVSPGPPLSFPFLSHRRQPARVRSPMGKYRAADTCRLCIISYYQFSCSVVSDSLQPRESQHARPPCPSPAPGVVLTSYIKLSLRIFIWKVRGLNNLLYFSQTA